jgi:dTDP-4-dehydrorhamnose reductase
MNDALIGYSGFVGSTLLRQRKFNDLYRSTNITDVRGKKFDLAICAAAPAQKWIANRDPENDLRTIEGLIKNLSTLQADRFVLISTVDVFKTPLAVDENSEIVTEGLHAYGRNRYLLEQFVRQHFSNSLIVRLPGLVGPYLRKNVIYDLKHDNNVGAIDTRGIFQFYPMANLWYDIKKAWTAGINLLHLTSEPISVSAIANDGFGRELHQETVDSPAKYDMRSVHSHLWRHAGSYQYDYDSVVLATRTYAQTPEINPPGVTP